MAQYQLIAQTTARPGFYQVFIRDDAGRDIAVAPMPKSANDAIEHLRAHLSPLWHDGDIARVGTAFFNDIESALAELARRL